MSAVVVRQLGRRLRQLRRAAGKTEGDVEEAGLGSRTKLWRIETGKVTPKVADVRGLCWLYGADRRTTDMLGRWALGGRADGWWEHFDDTIPTRDGLYLGLEAIAEHLYVYEPERIPALLQTPGYTRALVLSVHPDASDAAVTEHVESCQARQTALTRTISPIRLTAVLGEGALTRPVGSPTLMREQIRTLRKAADHPHLDIRYLRWSVGAHPAMTCGAFTILDFNDPADPAVVHLKTHTGARYLERPSELAAYRQILTRTYAHSVPVSEHPHAK